MIQASSDQTAEGCGRSQPRSASPSTEGNRPSDRGERSERWKGQLENVSGTATGGIAGVQLPKVESEKSSPRSSEIPVDPRGGISQLPSSGTDANPPARAPHSREVEVSTDTLRGISQSSPSVEILLYIS